MKSPFDPLYRLTGFLAVACLSAIAIVVLADVALRQFGGQIKSSDDFAGFALVGTALLGLGPTYRHGDHIRVGLVLDRFTGTTRRYIEIFVLVLAVIMVGWATWWIGKFVYDSWRFHEVTQGLLAIPLWIPQIVMPFGLGVLLLALVEDLVLILSGKPTSYMSVEQVEGDVARYE
jgi:TRAP-type C4-dicarboxylate transport system permease small subunit